MDSVSGKRPCVRMLQWLWKWMGQKARPLVFKYGASGLGSWPIEIHLFEFPDADFSNCRNQTRVPIIYTTRDILNVLLELSSCLSLNFKVKAQGHNIFIYLFEFPDIGLVIVDTKNEFLWYILPEIWFQMHYFFFFHSSTAGLIQEKWFTIIENFVVVDRVKQGEL